MEEKEFIEQASKKDEKKTKERRKGKSILMIDERKKRQEPKLSDETIYVVPKNERKIFHLEVENRNYDQKTGKKLSKSHIVKLDGVREYKQFITNAFKTGLDYEIIHDPRPYFGMNKIEMNAQDKEILQQAGIDNRKK